MQRRAKKIDANQPEIVSAFRRLGCTVTHLHEVGDGCPDLVVGIDGMNLLVEVKDGSKVPSARKLTEDQVTWHGAWRGQKCVVKDIQEAIDLVACTRAFVAAVKKSGVAFPAATGYF